MNNDQFSKPTGWQRDLLRKLTSIEVDGIEAIREQVKRSSVRTIDEDGSFALDANGPPWVETPRFPIEATSVDIDGIPIQVLLHVVDKAVKEIEIYRVDGRRAPKEFNLANLQVTKASSK
jgi:hypothetical protein